MSAFDLLSRCRAAGIELKAEANGTLIWEAADDPPIALLAAVADSKAELLTLLCHAPTRDSAEAKRLLADLHAEVETIGATFRGQPPAPLATLLADALVIGARYVRDHELEAARGWNALELLQELVPHVRNLVARWKLARPTEVRPAPTTNWGR